MLAVLAVGAGCGGSGSVSKGLPRWKTRSFPVLRVEIDAGADSLDPGLSFTAESWQATFGRGIPFRARRAVIVLGDIHRNRGMLENFPHSPLIAYTLPTPIQAQEFHAEFWQGSERILFSLDLHCQPALLLLQGAHEKQ